MLQIGQVIVSQDIISKKFVCDLNACKGACCVEGESGAPLEEDELAVLDDIYDKVAPFLTPQGRLAVEQQGRYLIDSDGDYVTPLINGKDACAYTVFENGTASCGIEKAWASGAVNFRKPISCHLYPIRINKLKSGAEALNYHRWEICSAACIHGRNLKVPVYRFLKEPLIRKYGAEWYKELGLVAEQLQRP